MDETTRQRLIREAEKAGREVVTVNGLLEGEWHDCERPDNYRAWLPEPDPDGAAGDWDGYYVQAAGEMGAWYLYRKTGDRWEMLAHARPSRMHAALAPR